jgi:hypothetical protein
MIRGAVLRMLRIMWMTIAICTPNHHCKLSACKVVACLFFLSNASCGREYHIRRLYNTQLGSGRVRDIIELTRGRLDIESQDAIVCALQDRSATVRYFAAALLEAPRLADDGQRGRLVHALSELLDDNHCGTYERKVGLFGAALVKTGTIRARALLSLTTLVPVDFGFDKEAWRTYVRADESTTAPPDQ